MSALGSTNNDVGGGIDAWGNGYLTLSNCTIANNTATKGGGIYDWGETSGYGYALPVTLTDCTISGVITRPPMAAAVFYISHESSRRRERPSTVPRPSLRTVAPVTLNSTGVYSGGGITNDGTLTIANSTIAGNSAHAIGGGIMNYSLGTLTLTNALVADNVNSSGPDDIFNASGGTVTATYSLIGNNANSSITTAGNNIVNPATVGLSTLGSNGGSTQTIALLPGSAAIGTGESVTGISTDQRGITLASPADIGAFQLETVTSNSAAIPVNTSSQR